MALTTSSPWLRRAQQEGYAVGAFNANTLEQIQSIVLAADIEQAPVVIQISMNAARYLGMGDGQVGMRFAAEMGRVAAESVRVPVVLHLDHGSSADVLLALSLGFTSVMFDGSDLPFEENIAVTRWLCAAAHEAGVTFEAELGEVPRSGVSGQESAVLTDPSTVAEFVERTGIDALAVSVGSVHALKRKEVLLDLDRLAVIRSAVQTPLVLHGSSGVIDDSICAGIRLGLCKVNVATQLNGVFTRAIRHVLAEREGETDPRKYLGPAREAMAEQVRERIRLFGSAEKAGR